ncbi:MAG: L,D-transpeptidase family protein [Cypionkella sp.]|nr:L,D-transpeptidase family protein [Cypionkella sp.]
MLGRRTFLLAGTAVLAGCGAKFRRYTGPRVTKVEVHKGARRLYLLSGPTVLKTYKIKLGGNPIGHKQFEGDQKTPEGAYLISHRNPNSTYHLSLGISYPNDADRAYAKSQGKKPGGDIFIHGGPKKLFAGRDWTAGCIAVRDNEMEEIFAMVNPGTPINIYP